MILHRLYHFSIAEMVEVTSFGLHRLPEWGRAAGWPPAVSPFWPPQHQTGIGGVMEFGGIDRSA
jgi:hypothetical protein